jgi:hypothetical protein
MEGCNVTILQPFIVSACRCLWLFFRRRVLYYCVTAHVFHTDVLLSHTHTHTHTTDLIPMPHAVGFCMDINMGNAPLLKRQSCLVFWILVQFVWRELKPAWDTRFIIAGAGLTNVSHLFIVMMNGAHLHSGSAGRRDIPASITLSVIICFMMKRVNLPVCLFVFFSHNLWKNSDDLC